MEWDDKFNTGIRNIDEQHQALFHLLKRLQSSLDNGMNSREVGLALKALVDYTHTHFSDEEKLMAEIGFPGFEQHRILHRMLIDEVKHILLRIKAGETVNAFEMIDFLKHWLKEHILSEDLKIAKFFEEKKANARK